MAQKITTYSAGFEGDAKHAELLALGSFQDEIPAMHAIRSVMGWAPLADTELEACRSPIFQVTYEVAAFSLFETPEDAQAASPPYAGAPRMTQHNALVVPG